MKFEKALEGMREGKRARCNDSDGIFYIDKWGDVRVDYPNRGERNYSALFNSIEILSEEWEFTE